MRKSFLLASCALAAMFTACSSDEIVVNQPGTSPTEQPNPNAEQIITVAVESAGSNFATRDPNVPSVGNRELWTAAPIQRIDEVHVILLPITPKAGLPTQYDAKDINNYTIGTTVSAGKTFTDWMGAGSTVTNTTYKAREAQWKLNDTEKLAAGTYAAYAVGYVKDGSYTEVGPFSLLKKGSSFTFPRIVEKGSRADEIFAGVSVLKVTSSQEVSANVSLHRQISGAIGYFTKIPVFGDKDHSTTEIKTLRLVASNKNEGATFAHFNSSFTKEGETGSNAFYYVNGFVKGVVAKNAQFYGSTTNDAYEVYSTTIAAWFPNGDVNGDGIYDYSDYTEAKPAGAAKDNWVNPLRGRTDPNTQATLKDVTVQKGAILCANFLQSFAGVANKQTFELQGLDQDGNIIRAWKVNLPDGDGQLGKTVKQIGKAVLSNNETQTIDLTSLSFAESKNTYSVVRNHLYSIGKRMKSEYDPDDPTPSPDPDPTPTPGPDNPQDLSKESIIVVNNAEWEHVHDMELD